MRGPRNEAGPPLTLEVIERIETLRTKACLSREELASKALVSTRRLQEWVGALGRARAQSGNPLRPRIQSIELLAKALGISVEELLRPAPSLPRHIPLPTKSDFGILAAIAKQVDQDLIEITRSLSTRPMNTIRTAYRRVLNDGLREHGYDAAAWVRLLEESAANGRLVETAPPADLVIDVGSNFESLVFRTPDARELPVRNPELLWDCACKTPGSKAKATECPIHGHALGNEVNEIFNRGMIEIRWRGVATRWRNERDLWPPSVDSFSFLMELAHRGVFKEDCESVLDLGSGTGFLGVVFAKLNHSARRLVLSDWLLTPSLFGALNWASNRRGREDVTLALKVGMFSDWMIESPSAIPDDVVLCHPPYLPLLPGFEAFGVHAVVAGTELLSHVVEHAPLLGRRVFLQFSHLARAEAQRAAKPHGHRLAPLNSNARLVPFRVRRAWSEIPAYFSALKSMKGGLITRPRNRHPFWHRIQAYEVRPSPRLS